MRCLHHLIEAQAARTPERPALAFEGARLTYAELERRTGALAAELRRCGAEPEVRVGLFVERSHEMVLGVLGILKSGAAYVPVEPAYPQERIEFMLADAGVAIVVTQSRLAPKLAASGARLVCLDELDWNAPAFSAPQVRPEHLAYVIYTSGSTGRPKGVGIEQRNIVNYVEGVITRLRFEPGMNHATVSTIAADLGNTVIFPALASGGCLHVIAQERAESHALLSEYFARERIDVLKIVPSHLAAVQGTSGPELVMPARRLILGGEPSRVDWIERLRAAAPQCLIFNHYGPTETTVGVLTYEVGPELPDTPTRTLPLGRALPGISVYLLAEDGRPVLAGEKGELCIGGRGVARGYLNRPELTAEKFVADPFSAEPGARMYRSGDLARMLPDGNIEFCGRLDHQVKVHGFRVELGEIECALREHAGAQEAVVLLREEARGERELVACVSANGQPPSPRLLRERLKERLPQYMVPSAFVVLERMPLTANGKIDRQALAALPAERPAAELARSAPTTQTQKMLVSLWEELLGVEVGIDDDLFDLGAHSLMAMKALTRMRELFGVNLALRNLFERPTIGGFADMIDGIASLNSGAPPRTGEREEIVL